MKLVAVLVAAVALAAGLAGGQARGAGRTVTCSTHGLAFSAGRPGHRSSYRVLSLRAQGIGCSSARRVAERLAADLALGRAISASGSDGVFVSTTTCTGCAARTDVTVDYPAGKLTATLSGTARFQPPTVPMPAFPFPTVPLPPSPPPGSGLVV